MAGSSGQSFSLRGYYIPLTQGIIQERPREKWTIAPQDEFSTGVPVRAKR